MLSVAGTVTLVGLVAALVSTVGYGDRYPVTAEGRVVAGALMVSGSRSSAS